MKVGLTRRVLPFQCNRDCLVHSKTTEADQPVMTIDYKALYTSTHIIHIWPIYILQKHLPIVQSYASYSSIIIKKPSHLPTDSLLYLMRHCSHHHHHHRNAGHLAEMGTKNLSPSSLVMYQVHTVGPSDIISLFTLSFSH